MIKISVLGFVSAVVLAASGAFAGDKPEGGDKDKAAAGCCASSYATGVVNNEKPLCTDLAVLNLNADQKTKLEAWQADCMKDGCTRDARHKFFQQAKGILTAEQFSKLKTECKKQKEAKTTT